MKTTDRPTDAATGLVFQVPGRFYPPNSLVGLLIQQRIPDRYRAETTYLVVVVTIGCGVVALALAATSLAGTEVLPACGYVALVAVGVSCLGFSKGIRIEIDRRRLVIRRGSVQSHIRLAEITSLAELDPLEYHRGDARDPNTTSFVNDVRHMLMRISTNEARVVVAVPAPDGERLRDEIQERMEALREPSGVAEV